MILSLWNSKGFILIRVIYSDWNIYLECNLFMFMRIYESGSNSEPQKIVTFSARVLVCMCQQDFLNHFVCFSDSIGLPMFKTGKKAIRAFSGGSKVGGEGGHQGRAPPPTMNAPLNRLA